MIQLPGSFDSEAIVGSITISIFNIVESQNLSEMTDGINRFKANNNNFKFD